MNGSQWPLGIVTGAGIAQTLLGVASGTVAPVVVGLQSALLSAGDSLSIGTASATYAGVPFALRVGGPFRQYDPAVGFGLAGQSAAAVRTALAARSMTDRMKVIIVIAGRNGVLTDTAGTRAALLGIDSDEAALNNVTGGGATRVLYATVPYKPSEVAAGPGTTNYDLVTAHNTWLTGTAFVGRTFDISDVANSYPAGDDVHCTDGGYDVADKRAATKLISLAWLPTTLPAVKPRLSINVSAAGKYLWYKTVDATNDALPKTPNTAESTFLVWFRAKSAASTGVLFGRYAQATTTARMAIRYFGGSLTGYYGNAVAGSWASALPVDTNWHLACLSIRNITGTYKGDLGFDGVYVAAQQTCGAMSATPPIILGEAGDLSSNGGGAGTSFAFLADYLPPIILNVGLTQAQFNTIYNGGVPLAPTAMAQAANIISYPDLEHPYLFSMTRGIGDWANTLGQDMRATGLVAADFVANAP